MPEATDGDALPWHLGIFDAHCHPTDTMSTLPVIPGMRAKVLTVMATRAQDQHLVAEAADKLGVHETDRSKTGSDWSEEQRIVPCFGWHPWFSHQMYDDTAYNGKNKLDQDYKIAHYQSVLTPQSEDIDFLSALPDPRPFSHFLAQTKTYLEKYPLALIGEVGLDKSFRIPEAWLPEHNERRDDSLTPGGREGRRLSPYRVHMDHQRKVLTAQLHLAGEMGRAVSIHGVQAHGVLFDTVSATWKGHEREVVSKRLRKRRESVQNAHADEGSEQSERPASKPAAYPPRICLHSFSGPAETIKQWLNPAIPATIFFSFSTAINFSGSSPKTEETIRMVPDENILIESDLHTAGERMDDHLESIIRKVCDIKKWPLRDGVIQLGKNWQRFIFGDPV
ncbi:Metallo-dependent hydrolase [Viridothelium virens]|uniref:Metallo-dependent hydrolase n=1 Tax=Viridothelium virens TaxID=1048519 RepID=A0A6A6GZB1_VIRVR|nr:Metallo-dependent hydrolase [Viridothelium virens]